MFPWPHSPFSNSEACVPWTRERGRWEEWQDHGKRCIQTMLVPTAANLGRRCLNGLCIPLIEMGPHDPKAHLLSQYLHRADSHYKDCIYWIVFL